MQESPISSDDADLTDDGVRAQLRVRQLEADKEALAFQLDQTIANLARNEAEVARLTKLCEALVMEYVLDHGSEALRKKYGIVVSISS